MLTQSGPKTKPPPLLEWRAVKLRVGVLALQGDFAAHARALEALGCAVELVRRPAQLVGLKALAMPGGESTTMSLLLDASGLRQPLAEALSPTARGGGGLPVLATCAGVILLAQRLEGDSGSVKVQPLGLLDATVSRNAYGRQVDSFEAPLDIDWAALGTEGSAAQFHGVFIRAPRIVACGAKVQTACQLDGEPVLLRQGHLLAATFHPELSADLRLHAALLGLARV
jgi:pyridoxal 5'-phosphate synthase pdxT subunit